MLTKEERAKHWSNGADDYDWYIKQELEGFKAINWYNLIMSQCEKKENLRILDCGCGPGFFSVILSKNGNQVTGIDQAQGMLDKAKENAEKYRVDPEFRIMDLEHIDYPDNTFDLILSRNVTWNLSEPDAVYAEWMRLLKKDGVLLVFDSTWYKTLFDEELAAEVKRRAEEYKAKYGDLRNHDSDTNDSHDHVDPKTLPLSNVERPDWDEKKFTDMGLKDIVVNRDISDYVYNDHDKLLYGATPMFMVKGTKKAENVIRVCTAGSCDRAGSGELLAYIKEKLGIKPDEDFSPDGKYEAEAADCLWLCKQPPVISVNGKLYTEVDERKADELISGS